ncbi:MAG: hypothetical protein ACOX3P_03760 [Saccharofermentanales bacterium]|jgi:ABC-type molybdate transport system substrate-binding protein|nr:hypothetical protein [Bacillota bacterium]NLB08623.1 hypothetical protein [Clostridiales bacterium]
MIYELKHKEVLKPEDKKIVAKCNMDNLLHAIKLGDNDSLYIYKTGIIIRIVTEFKGAIHNVYSNKPINAFDIDGECYFELDE